MRTNKMPAINEITQSQKPTCIVESTKCSPNSFVSLLINLGIIIPPITEAILDTVKLSPNAKANSFPLNH